MTDEQRFLKFVDTAGDCWKWLGWTHRNGYGGFAFRERKFLAHRASYILFKGEIPSGLCVLHSCDVRSCVNPAHLSLGTKKENTADMIRKDRHFKHSGETSPRSILTEADVRVIRSWPKKKGYRIELAGRFGVSVPTIEAVVRGYNWKGVL